MVDLRFFLPAFECSFTGWLFTMYLESYWHVALGNFAEGQICIFPVLMPV